MNEKLLAGPYKSFQISVMEKSQMYKLKEIKRNYDKYVMYIRYKNFVKKVNSVFFFMPQFILVNVHQKCSLGSLGKLFYLI